MTVVRIGIKAAISFANTVDINWRAHSYYTTVPNALVGLVNQGVRDTDLADLKTVCDKIEQLHKDVLEVCMGAGQ